MQYFAHMGLVLRISSGDAESLGIINAHAIENAAVIYLAMEDLR
ncbi:hypothetical protein [Methylobacillus rhizosphaerae]|nr:hypothetical protein [Methylobacillus rhizosphaerae]